MKKTTFKTHQNLLLWNHKTSVSEYYTTNFMGNTGYPELKKMKRRAISDIIAVLLLLAITVAGAVLVSAFFQGSNIFRPDSTSTGAQTASVKITGYDTRDGANLSEITGFDNQLDAPTPYLCTITCSGVTADNPPATSGTEFIILTVMNQGINKVVLQGIEINGVEHLWEATTGGNALSLGAAGTNYPNSGYFSVIPTSDPAPTQLSSRELDRNGEARLVIKLSEDITPDIGINEPIRTRLITNLIDPPATIITSGGVR